MAEEPGGCWESLVSGPLWVTCAQGPLPPSPGAPKAQKMRALSELLLLLKAPPTTPHLSSPPWASWVPESPL